MRIAYLSIPIEERHSMLRKMLESQEGIGKEVLKDVAACKPEMVDGIFSFGQGFSSLKETIEEMDFTAELNELKLLGDTMLADMKTILARKCLKVAH